MKSFKLLFLFVLSAQVVSAQWAADRCFKPGAPFSDCAAVFLDNKVLVDDYSPEGKCRVSDMQEGKIVVSTVNLNDQGAWPFQLVGFKVAVRNAKTNTVWSYSDETLYEVNIEDILKKCEKGDSIVIVLAETQYSLPHNEIEIVDGC